MDIQRVNGMVNRESSFGGDEALELLEPVEDHVQLVPSRFGRDRNHDEMAAVGRDVVRRFAHRGIRERRQIGIFEKDSRWLGVEFLVRGHGDRHHGVVLTVENLASILLTLS